MKSAIPYPTIRVRVDRMIESLKQAVAREPHPVMQLLAVLVERGEITASAVQALRDAYRQEKQA